MATLVLTAVGSAVAGPIGGAIGAIIGQQFDQNILFRPKGREGLRLQELAVQTSSYGSQIPRLFGRMRVAGTVIWAADLKETRTREGGGKGRPSRTIYSYSACFAVALSSRRIRGIGRIWADGKIFRGAAGDFKTETQFSFHDGHEDQSVDGMMASAEAAGGTPAYRGLALAVFDDMDLTEYGNRIPSLTFEVIADDGLVTILDIMADISGQLIGAPPGDTLIGFAAGGEDRQAALQSLAAAIPMAFSCDPAAIDRIAAEIRPQTELAAVRTISSDFVGATGETPVSPPECRTESAAMVPRQLSIRYYDPARDYQSGIQSALRPGTGRITRVRDFPATLSASHAKEIALVGLWSEYDERNSLRVSVPLASLPLRPGMLLEFTEGGALWRIRECEIGNGHVQLSLTSAKAQSGLFSVDTEQGRSVSDADLLAGSTRLVLVDLPFAIDAPGIPSPQARLYAAAAGESGWRNAQLFASASDGTPGIYTGEIPAPTVIGFTNGTLGSANPALIDQINHIEVVLQNSEMQLAHANDSQLLAGTNIALVGREIVQFAEAMPLGDGRFRLSRFIRGLGGTEGEVSQHSSSEDFVLLDAGSMVEISSTVYSPFTPTTLFAVGRDDAMPVSAFMAAPGRALLPWSPVHPLWFFQDDGSLVLNWTRRSRAGTIWPDHVEVPLGEEFEKYRIELFAGSSETMIFVESTVSQLNLPSAHLAPLLVNNPEFLVVKIYQVGDHGMSEPVEFVISL